MSMSEIRRHCVGHFSVNPSTRLFPASRVWPMGFGWSSFVAQSSMVESCRRAGFSTNRMIAPDLPVPVSRSSVFAIATDDVVHLTKDGPAAAATSMHKLERGLENDNFLINHKKDITGVSEGTAIGLF